MYAAGVISKINDAFFKEKNYERF
ncbi:hypothetical protein TRIP_B350054 [uncultured Desulfatiglans sp.]|uniref:Uncharacterized protein n=1 Tax=Uncultured Desulfatiglans sp. TaxID=1748965 RepID=A0A653AA45_UNCDX|nr:hypothetical protein TRIP_B350054 [uncultured Desulfatiglans sp.]